MPPLLTRPLAYRISRPSSWIVLLMAFAVGSYYLWAARASGSGFEWGRDLGGFYDHLGRAFTSGQLSMPFTPSPELLALPNPWDWRVGGSYKISDLALYNQRYYLYHGAAPALLLFTPWRLLTGHDLPENFAVFLFALGGFLFSCGTLLRVLRLAGATVRPALLSFLLLALGVCQGVPFLLSRIFVYEVAIAGGYFCLSGALCFLAYAIPLLGNWFLVASGLMFGLAVACRPNLFFAAGIATAAMTIYVAKSQHRRAILVFLIPLCVIGASIAAYNYLRFGNPFEFGLNYLLSDGPNQNRVQLSTDFVLPGLYFFLWCAPDFSFVFPWVRLALRYPFGSPSHPFPPGFFLEPTVGVLYVAPFIAAAFFIPRHDRLKRTKPADFQAARTVLGIALLSGIGVLLSTAWTGFTTQRYEVDFLPSFVVVALANFAIHIDRTVGWKRLLIRAALTVLVGFSAIVNLALGISGPNQDMLHNHPKSYLRLANWFSPTPRLLPLLNPDISIAFTTEFKSQPEGFREPLVTLGGVDQHFIYVEHAVGALRIVSRSGRRELVHELKPLDRQAVRIAVSYMQESGSLVTKLNGDEILSQPIPMLLTAPAEVTIGENRIDPDLTSTRFTGRIYDIQQQIKPHSPR